jgi:hypothetical protein
MKTNSRKSKRPAEAKPGLLDHRFEIPWSALRAAREALAKRAQDARCSAVNHARPVDKALTVLGAEAMERAVARLDKFERELPNAIVSYDAALSQAATTQKEQHAK